MIKKLLYFSLLTITFNLMCMQDLIEINGESKPLLEHIKISLESDNKHLSKVDFFKYENEKLHLISKGKPDLSESDLQELKAGNYLFIPFYTIEKRDDVVGKISAVIIGTNNRELLPKLTKELHVLYMNPLMAYFHAARARQNIGGAASTTE